MTTVKGQTDNGGHMSDWGRGVFTWRFLLLSVVLPSLSAIIFVYLRPGPSLPDDPILRASQLVASGVPARAKQEIESWFHENLDDVFAHRAYISTHCSISGESAEGDERQGDEEFLKFYENLRSHGSETRKDLANYGLGYYWSFCRDFKRALECYDRVENKKLLFLNLSRGDAYASLNQHGDALEAYNLELQVEGEVDSKVLAIGGLSESLLRLRYWDALEALTDDPRIGPLASGNARRTVLLQRARFGEYFGFFVETYLASLRWDHALLALFGSVIWLLVIRWWDFFEKEPIWITLISVGLGALVAHVVFLFHDVLSLWHHIGLGGSVLEDLAYCVLAIGLVEEVVKILPIFPVLILTRHIDEPIDWLIYGGLSALGFSTLENYFYFSQLGTHVAVGRTFISTPLHIALSGMLALSVPEAKQRGWNPVLTFLGSLVLVSVVHGLYDFFILGPWESARPVSVLIALGWGMAFMAMLENIHTLSPFREKAISHSFDSTPWFVRAFMALVIVVFLLNSWRLTSDEATIRFLVDLTVNLLFVFMLIRYGSVRIERKWRRMLV